MPAYQVFKVFRRHAGSTGRLTCLEEPEGTIIAAFSDYRLDGLVDLASAASRTAAGVRLLLRRWKRCKQLFLGPDRPAHLDDLGRGNRSAAFTLLPIGIVRRPRDTIRLCDYAGIIIAACRGLHASTDLDGLLNRDAGFYEQPIVCIAGRALDHPRGGDRNRAAPALVVVVIAH